MKPNCSCFEDGGFASVVSGVGRTGIPDRRVGCRNEFQGFVGLVDMQNPFFLFTDLDRFILPDDKMALCFPPILSDNGDAASWRFV